MHRRIATHRQPSAQRPYIRPNQARDALARTRHKPGRQGRAARGPILTRPRSEHGEEAVRVPIRLRTASGVSRWRSSPGPPRRVPTASRVLRRAGADALGGGVLVGVVVLCADRAAVESWLLSHARQGGRSESRACRPGMGSVLTGQKHDARATFHQRASHRRHRAWHPDNHRSQQLPQQGHRRARRLLLRPRGKLARHRPGTPVTSGCW